MLTPYSLTVLTLLAILGGSLLGSLLSYLSGPSATAAARPGQSGELGYPPGWPSRQNTGPAPVYSASRAATPRRRSRWLLSVPLAFAVGFAASAATVFSLISPWSVQTDLRHLAAGLHCEIATQVGLSQARLGQPGYHTATDPDGNGISCEPQSHQLARLPEAPATAMPNAVTSNARLSATRLSWPGALTSR